MTLDMNKKVLKLINNKSQIVQRTKEWHDERKKLITATDAASALEANPYKTKVELLHNKCEPYVETYNDATNWGTKYEPVAIQLYEKIENDKVYELGLLKHNKYKWLAASPDGIRLNGKLVEIKCVYNRKIRDEEPFMYWVQVQIQLEVCDLDECDLFQCKFYEYKNKKEFKEDNTNHKGCNMNNGEEFYWKLEEYSCKTIKRDKEWFKKSLPILLRFHTDIINKQKSFNHKVSDKNKKRKRSNEENNEEYQSTVLKRVKRTRAYSFEEYKNYNWEKWVSATETKNYMLNDPLLDWLNMYGGKYNIISDKQQNNSYDFNEYIMKKGIEFEKAIYENLNNRFKDKIVNVANNYEGYSTNKLNKTIEYMRQGVPLIYHGVLHNKDNNTFGIPDIIIRSDYINKVVECEEQDDSLNDGCVFSDKWHYRVIEIKYTTLKIHNNYIYNIGNIIPYKSQAIIYNDALSTIQQYNSQIAYLFGRKVNIDSKKYIGFYKLGKIDIKNRDQKIKEKTDTAITWMKELKNNGSNWSINPPSRQELYPNMCNKFDYPWRGIKVEMSNKLKEITMLWNCGIKERNVAFKSNIKKWNDKKWIKSNSKNNKNHKSNNILTNIVKINTQKKNKIDIGNIKTIKESIVTSNKIEFYVDFETCGDLNHNFDEYITYNKKYSIEPDTRNNTIIFMIGIGWINPTTNEWVFKTFITDKITYNEEKKIINQWIKYMKNISTRYNNRKKPLVYHWSPAEVSCYNNSRDRHNFKYNIKWMDLLNVFKQSPITFKNVYNYGLKNIAKKMAENKMISTKWEDNNLDGLGAMVATWNCDDKIYEGDKRKLKDFDEMKQIIKYNEIDCKVMWDILNYIKVQYIHYHRSL